MTRVSCAQNISQCLRTLSFQFQWVLLNEPSSATAPNSPNPTHQPNDSSGTNGCFFDAVDKHCGLNGGTTSSLSYLDVNSFAGT